MHSHSLNTRLLRLQPLQLICHGITRLCTVIALAATRPPFCSLHLPFAALPVVEQPSAACSLIETLGRVGAAAQVAPRRTHPFQYALTHGFTGTTTSADAAGSPSWGSSFQSPAL
eukprot:GHVU01167041.1.p3 GENE.GHVU01167041.1~~GHVU01167041.1.p3  ORF type:complete len:115 (+),score=4.86 GHVU01167041.1:635-979(+)